MTARISASIEFKKKNTLRPSFPCLRASDFFFFFFSKLDHKVHHLMRRISRVKKADFGYTVPFNLPRHAHNSCHLQPPTTFCLTSVKSHDPEIMVSDLSDHGCFASTHLASGRACPHFLNKHRGSPAKRNKKLSKARAGTHEMQQPTKIPCLVFCYFAISSSWTIPAKANPILDLLGHYGGNILLVCPGNYHQAIAPRATRHGII